MCGKSTCSVTELLGLISVYIYLVSGRLDDATLNKKEALSYLHMVKKRSTAESGYEACNPVGDDVACEGNSDCKTEAMSEIFCSKRNIHCSTGECHYPFVCHPEDLECRDGNECDKNPCKNGGTCSDVDTTYSCACAPGWEGGDCVDECQDYTYGSDCAGSCNHCKDGDVCDKVTGVCPAGCEPGWDTDDCSIECQDYTYGSDCAGSCNHCKDGDVCDKVTGVCPAGCEPGWDANDCSIECQDYTYGSDCSGSCLKCKADAVCDKVTGMCPNGCDPGWKGLDCNTECQDYTYGSECSGYCLQCNGGAVCDKVNGTCPTGCEPGWEGHDCNTECQDYNYGSNCSGSCLQCNNDDVCDKVTGMCPSGCKPGWVGLDCNLDCRHGPADIVFLVDSSTSQSNENFQKQLDFISSFANIFIIGPDRVQISIISYSFDPSLEFHLNQHSSNTTLVQSIQNISYMDGATYTAPALQAAAAEIWGSTGGRTLVTDYVIILTDGLSSDRKDAIYQASLLRQQGLNILAVEFGPIVSHSELITITGSYSKVFSAETNDALYSVLNDLAPTYCEDCSMQFSDVVFLLDTSTNLAPAEFNGNINSIMFLVSLFNISSTSVRISYIRFTIEVETALSLDATYNKDDVYRELQQTFQLGKSSNVTKALRHVRETAFSPSNGHRSGERKVVVLFSNGNFGDITAAKTEAELLQQDGVYLAVVGYGSNVKGSALLELISNSSYFFNPGIVTDPTLESLGALVSLVEYTNCTVRKYS